MTVPDAPTGHPVPAVALRSGGAPPTGTARRGPGPSPYAPGSGRPWGKVLPEHARTHNRALVLQNLYRSGRQSRADLARITGLTPVTISDLVAHLIAERIVVELGPREDARPGKPATMLDIDRQAFQIVGVDLSDHASLTGAVLDLDGQVQRRSRVPLHGRTGPDALAAVDQLVDELLAATTAPVLGIGVGSPGIVDLAGTIVRAPNLGLHDVALQTGLAARTGLPVVVANDANVAVLAERTFAGGDRDLLLVRISHGVGAGLLVSGSLVFGSRFGAGEIGHVVVGGGDGEVCACGRRGCLETWLAAPRLTARLERAGSDAERSTVLTEAGRQLGTALAPVVGALDVAEIVLSGPLELLGGPVMAAALDVLRSRTLARSHGDVALRLTTLGDDIVVRGAAALVLSRQLGVA